MKSAVWAALILVLAASAARADGVVTAPPAVESIPANGIDPTPRRGVFAETAFGVFTTLGGSAGLSNGQPYLSMAVGTHLGDSASIFLSLAIGSSSASCYDAAASGDCLAADSFAATFLEAGASYGAELVHRLNLSGKLLVGGTQLAPSPVHDSTLTAPNNVPGSLFGPHVGIGASLDYDTHLDHFGVGIDLTGRYTFASRPDSGSFGLISIALMPRVRYVF